VVKKAVAPASRKGSFLLNSIKACRSKCAKRDKALYVGCSFMEIVRYDLVDKSLGLV
jgi:hypothetical protein